MAFALNMRGTGYVTSYAAAVAMYNRATPWRGEDPAGERPLPNKRHRTMGVRMDNEDVVFRYHHTDVIRWRQDGSYTINTGGYDTLSTCGFASHFMPQRHWLTKSAAHLRIDTWVYPIVGHEVTVSETGTVSGPGLGRFEAKRVNRAKANTLLATTGYPEYRAWYKAMYPMVKDTMPAMYRRRYVGAEEMQDMLRDEATWHDLMMSQMGDPSTTRAILYAYRGLEHRIWEYEYHTRLDYTAVTRKYTTTTAG
jgi:hypothetical protein